MLGIAKPGSLWTWLWNETILHQGSTRPVALLRIGLVFILWSEWGSTYYLPKSHMVSLPYTLFGLSFFLSTTVMLVGYKTRIATAWTAFNVLCLYALQSPLGVPPELVRYHAHNNLITVVTCLLCLTPCGTSLSIDRWLTMRRAIRENKPVPPEHGDLWATRLIAFQLSMVYFWAAFDKTNYMFLSGERLQEILMAFFLGSDPPAVPGFTFGVMALAVSTVVLEYVLAFGLWFDRTRGWCCLAGFAFHGIIYYTLPVMTFSAVSCLLYLSFFPPDRVNEFISQLLGQTQQTRAPIEVSQATSPVVT